MRGHRLDLRERMAVELTEKIEGIDIGHSAYMVENGLNPRIEIG